MRKFIKVLSVLIALVAVVSLASCAPKDGDAAVKKMEKAGYTAVWSANSKVQEDGAVGTLTATKGGSLGAIVGGVLDGDGLIAVKYDTSAHAKAAFDKSKDAEGKTSVVKVGKWLVSGSDAAIKAFK